MKFKECMKKGICISMAIMMLLTGCGSATESTYEDINDSTELAADFTEETKVDKINLSSDNTKLLASLRDKYGVATVDYSDNIMTIERDETLKFKLGFEPYEDGYDNLSDYFCIYQDAEMKYPVTDGFVSYDYENKCLTIEPPTMGIAEVHIPSGSEIDISDLSGNYLYDEEFGNNWGNLEQLYFVQKLDMETGEELETPLITILRVNTEIETAPKVSYSCNDKGEAYISWKPVEGATEYLLFTVMKTDEGFNNYSYVFDRISDTSWTAESDSFDDGVTYSMNQIFQNYITSADDMGAGGMENMNEDFFETMPDYVGVIAINENGSSPVSNLYCLNDYSKLLPNCFAHYENELEGNNLFHTSVELLPAEISITMCDGSTSRRVIDYDFENATIEDDYGESKLSIMGYANGTQLCQEYTVVTDSDTIEQDLKALQKRQDALKNKGGNLNRDISIDDGSNDDNAPKSSSTDINTDISVSANSALSEYIALYMLNSAEEIDLSMFSESINKDVVCDAFMEAQYQNPLVMGIKDAGYDSENRILYVLYDDSPEETASKRDAVNKKAEEIVAEIITDDMTDLEKEMAINDYLCETVVYDNAALENAEQYDFANVDDEFLDSFTPYGCLMNGVGVCASYAGSFKILADKAGLESIVVTGLLDGNLPHAWNRVKIGDQWVTIDSTNNDNDTITNVLMNVSDYGINDVLVEDERFLIDEKLFDYTCNTDDHEYYRYNNKYFDLDTITNELVAELRENDNAMLRTDYKINDSEFQTIAQNVADEIGGEIKGYYWLGVIHLSK